MSDDRGRPATLLDPYELNLIRRHDVIPAETLQAISNEVGFGLPRWQRRGYLACVLAFFACVVFLLIWKTVRRAGVDAVEYVLWPTNLAVFAFGAFKFWQSGRQARAKQIRTVMLEYLRCPHCGTTSVVFGPIKGTGLRSARSAGVRGDFAAHRKTKDHE
ncbi:MAG: hypothetical protein PVI86_01235 [Phycisphaerae bacterium]|jgi:hypothetical protein